MRRLRARSLCFMACIACSGGDDDRPPAASCPNQICVSPVAPGPVRGGSTGSTGGADGGFAGAGTDAGDPSTVISGNVLVLGTEDFTQGSEYTDLGVVGAEGPSRRVTSEFTGPDYRLDGVVRDPAVWVDVEPTVTSLDLMPTIQRADTRGGSADLVLVRTVTMENIGTGLLSPISLSPDRGHAVVQFLDDSGRGVPGVVIDDHPGSVVAYDAGNGIFRDDQPETTETGRAVILDAQSLPFPGSVTRIGFVGATRGAVDVKFAAGAVTVLGVLL